MAADRFMASVSVGSILSGAVCWGLALAWVEPLFAIPGAILVGLPVAAIFAKREPTDGK